MGSLQERQSIDTGTAERVSPIPIGIYNETDRLTKAVIWGPVGAEALIAELLPTKDSLFLARMDVPKARQEAIGFQKALEGFGVNIRVARDEFARLLPIDESDDGVKKALREVPSVRNAILDKARAICDGNHAELQAEIGKTEATGNPNGRHQIWPSGIEQELDFLLGADILRYGVGRAIALNKALILDPKIPMGDAIYARDQMNVLLGRMVQSSMTFPIRQPEVAVYERVYREAMGLPDPIVLPNDSRYKFEGGDAYIHNGFIYVGVGFRTSMEAAEYIYQELRKELGQHGLGFAVVIDTRTQRTFDEEMEAMHLDTFSNPIGKKAILVSTEDVEPRRVEVFRTDGSGNIIHEDRGSFVQHLQSMGEDIVYLSKADQANFGCNFLAIDENTILAPMENETLRQELEKRGKTLVVVPLFESTRGYGASHCMTGQLARSR